MEKNINPQRIHSPLHRMPNRMPNRMPTNETCVSVDDQKKGKPCVKRGEPGCKTNGCCCVQSSISGQPTCQKGGAGAGSFCD